MSSKITPAMYKAKVQENLVAQIKSFVQCMEKDIDNALEIGGNLNNIKFIYTKDAGGTMDCYCGPNKPYRELFISEWSQVIQRYTDAGWTVHFNHTPWSRRNEASVTLSITEKVNKV